MTTRKLIEKISARVFGNGPGGGNPVTVFASSERLSGPLQKRLAMGCDWESVMVSKREKEMAFFMPSGEEVSFCAHAALGGAVCASSNTDDSSYQYQFRTQLTKEEQVVLLPSKDATDPMACLEMDVQFGERKVTHPASLYRLLREHLGVVSTDLYPKTTRPPPTFMNSSVARPKTLVYVNSVEHVLQAKTPRTADSADDSSERRRGRTSFAAACGAIDDSTGIYLYAFKQDEKDAWECRQFPRNSGYPEDPATGIAAAALAASLHETNIRLPLYKFYQGTTMGRPSLIQVVNLKFMGGGRVTFGLQGKVEVDGLDYLDLEDDERDA